MLIFARYSYAVMPMAYGGSRLSHVYGRKYHGGEQQLIIKKTIINEGIGSAVSIKRSENWR